MNKIHLTMLNLKSKWVSEIVKMLVVAVSEAVTHQGTAQERPI